MNLVTKCLEKRNVSLLEIRSKGKTFGLQIQMFSQEFQNYAPCNENGVYLLGQQELTQFICAVCAKMP